MSEQILNRANVLTILQQMSCKRMSERVRAGLFGDICFNNRLPKRFLQTRLALVMSSGCVRARVFA